MRAKIARHVAGDRRGRHAHIRERQALGVADLSADDVGLGMSGRNGQNKSQQSEERAQSPEDDREKDEGRTACRGSQFRAARPRWPVEALKTPTYCILRSAAVRWVLEPSFRAAALSR